MCGLTFCAVPVLLGDMSGSGDGLASYPLSRVREWGATGWGGADKRKGEGAGATWRGGVVCPRVPPFRAYRVARPRGEGRSDGERHALVRPPSARTGVAQTRGKGSRPPCTPYLRANGVAAVNAEGVSEQFTLMCAPLLRERGVDGGKGEAGATRRGGRGMPLCAPLRAMIRVGEGSGRRGAGGGEWRGSTSYVLPNSCRVGWHATGVRIDEGAQSSLRKQNVPATKGPELVLEPVPLSPPPACQFVKNWVCKDRRTPRPPFPPLLLSPSPSLRVEKGAHNGTPLPLPVAPGFSLPPRPRRHVRAEGGHTRGRDGGMPPFPRVCATPFAWKEGARGMPLPVAPHLLSTVRAAPFTRKRGVRGYVAPVPFARERGAHEGMPLPFPLRHPVRAEREGHTAPPLHVAPAPSPSPPSRAPSSPPLAQTGTQEGHARAPPRPRTQDGDNAPTPVSLGTGDASPAPRTRGDAPPHAHHTAPLVHARGGVGASDPSARATPAPRVYAPRHTRRRRRVGAPSPAPLHARCATPALRFTRRTREEECVGRTQARTRRGSRNEAVKPEREANGGAAQRGGAERGATRVARGVARERKGGRIGAGMRKGDGDGDGECCERGEAKPRRGCVREQRAPRASRST
ncbi:hypothetical protein EDB83DRAFT_2652458 [Lactarius deliciosus]|nr:hypothetical protein EDB83DRAFT_2652458 [Lactarius deliciosus]